MRLPSYLVGPLVALTAVASAFGQTAGVVIADDVETGTLTSSETPPGRWKNLLVVDPSAPVMASMDAAHRGTWGIRVDDQHATTGSGNVAGVAQDVPDFDEGYARMWFRHSGGPTVGDQMLIQFEQSFGDTELRVRPSANSLSVGRQGTGAYQYTGSIGMVPAGTWHLIELGLTGYNSSGARMRVWVNGALVWTSPTFDVTGVSMSRFFIGPWWSDDRSWTGTLDFDDVRFSLVQPASRIVLQAPEAVQRLGCGALTVAFETSSQTPAAAPYPVAVALTPVPSSGVDFFSDANCTAPAVRNVVTVPADASALNASFRPRVDGSILVAASHPDFFGTQALVPVTADDGGERPDAGTNAPIAVITPATQTVDPGETVSLDGTASRAQDGMLVAYEWHQPEGPSGIRLLASPQQSFVSDAPGEYAFELVVIDDRGRRSLPARATLRVRGEPRVPEVGAFGCACSHGSGVLVAAAVGVWGLALRRRRAIHASRSPNGSR